MKKKGNGLLIGLSVLLVGVGGFFIIAAIRDKKLRKGSNKILFSNPDSTNSGTSSNNTEVAKSEVSGLSFPIKKGSKSDDVKVVQRLIMQYDNRLLPVYKDDGNFGIETQTALQKIIKKSSVDSQEDLNKITQAGAAKAGAFLSGFKLF